MRSLASAKDRDRLKSREIMDGHHTQHGHIRHIHHIPSHFETSVSKKQSSELCFFFGGATSVPRDKILLQHHSRTAQISHMVTCDLFFLGDAARDNFFVEQALDSSCANAPRFRYDIKWRRYGPLTLLVFCCNFLYVR